MVIDVHDETNGPITEEVLAFKRADAAAMGLSQFYNSVFVGFALGIEYSVIQKHFSTYFFEFNEERIGVGHQRGPNRA